MKKILLSMAALGLLASPVMAEDYIQNLTPDCEGQYNLLLDTNFAKAMGPEHLADLVRIRIKAGGDDAAADKAVFGQIIQWIGDGEIDGNATFGAAKDAAFDASDAKECTTQDAYWLMMTYNEVSTYLRNFGPTLKSLYKPKMKGTAL